MCFPSKKARWFASNKSKEWHHVISFRKYTSKQILCSVCGSLTVGEVSCSSAHSPMERSTRDKSIHSTAKEELRVTCLQPCVAALSRKWILSPQQDPGWHLDFNHLRGLNHTAGQLPGVGCRKAMGHHLLQVGSAMFERWCIIQTGPWVYAMQSSCEGGKQKASMSPHFLTSGGFDPRCVKCLTRYPIGKKH